MIMMTVLSSSIDFFYSLIIVGKKNWNAGEYQIFLIIQEEHVEWFTKIRRQRTVMGTVSFE